MTDIKSVEEKSKNMSAIKSADKKTELFIKKLLFLPDTDILNKLVIYWSGRIYG